MHRNLLARLHYKRLSRRQSLAARELPAVGSQSSQEQAVVQHMRPQRGCQVAIVCDRGDAQAAPQQQQGGEVARRKVRCAEHGRAQQHLHTGQLLLEKSSATGLGVTAIHSPVQERPQYRSAQ